MSGSLTVVDDAEFDAVVLRSPVPVLVDFFTEWCGPCKALAPTLEDLADEFGDTVRIVGVDAEASPEVAARYGVTGYPTMVLIRDGKEIDRPTARTRMQLRALLDEVRGVRRDKSTPISTPTEPTPLPAVVERLLDALTALPESDWQSVARWIEEEAKAATEPATDASDEDSAADTRDPEVVNAAVTRFQDDAEELIASRIGAGDTAQAIASAAAASYVRWMQPGPSPSHWRGALNTVPAARMSPYLPDRPAPADPTEAAALFLTALDHLPSESWPAIMGVNRDLFPFVEHSHIGTTAWLAAVVLLQAVASADLLAPEVCDAAWLPFVEVLDRAAIES